MLNLIYESSFTSLLNYKWDNKSNHYLNRYINFISSRKNIYIKGATEKHHILPRSMGGNNDKNNLINLTFREHYLAHFMLAKAFKYHAVASALCKMKTCKYGFLNNSKLFEMARKIFSETMSHNNKGKNNPNWGAKSFTPEVIEKMKKSHKNVKFTQKWKNNIGIASKNFWKNNPDKKISMIKKISGENSSSCKYSLEIVKKVLELFSQDEKQLNIADKTGMKLPNVKAICQGRSWARITGLVRFSSLEERKEQAKIFLSNQ